MENTNIFCEICNENTDHHRYKKHMLSGVIVCIKCGTIKDLTISIKKDITKIMTMDEINDAVMSLASSVQDAYYNEPDGEAKGDLETIYNKICEIQTTMPKHHTAKACDA